MSSNLAEKTLPDSIEPKRVLIVDDDHLTLTIVSQMIIALGFSVDLATCGLEAKQCLAQSTYDILITDLHMPDLDGYALSGWLKHKSDDTTVIIMTGYSRSDVANYMNSGIVNNWIFKPFTFNEMKETLHGCQQAKISVSHC